MQRPAKALLWVQHLLGIGHLMRASQLARHLAGTGWEMHVASGGGAVPLADFGAARLHQLPPLKAADEYFSSLCQMSGRILDRAFESTRRTKLLDLFAAIAPDALIFEHYPFGRRQLRFELEPLIEAALRRRPRPLLACSLRDVLVRRKPERDAETASIVSECFDVVLVHADPDIVRLEESFPATAGIKDKLVYTGYIGAPAAGPKASRPSTAGEIVVSAGGGAVSHRLVEAAIDAAREMTEHRFRILIGDNAPADASGSAGENVVIEPARRDFRSLLADAAVSVSQAGYNTVIDVLSAGSRAVFVPFASGHESEQTMRANRLAQRGLAHVLPERELSGATLANAVRRILGSPQPAARVRLDGAAVSDAVLRRLLAEHQMDAA
jgi:predicted glycosyltransferase